MGKGRAEANGANGRARQWARANWRMTKRAKAGRRANLKRREQMHPMGKLTAETLSRLHATTRQNKRRDLRRKRREDGGAKAIKLRPKWSTKCRMFVSKMISVKFVLEYATSIKMLGKKMNSYEL